jgi:hypothetical protein
MRELIAHRSASRLAATGIMRAGTSGSVVCARVVAVVVLKPRSGLLRVLW